MGKHLTDRTVLSFREGEWVEKNDQIALEKPFTIRVNRTEFATLVCTPDHLEDMVTGFLASEGVIRSFEDIEEMLFNEGQGIVNVKANVHIPLTSETYTKRVIGSCCGKSRHFYLQSDSRTAKTITRAPQLTAQECLGNMRALQSQSTTFKTTGGVHNAAIFLNGELLASRTDIGRHNALDKLYGYVLRQQLKPSDLSVAFSGRISSEVVIKLSKMGIGVLLSKSAPTELAIQLAEDLNITTVGFIRNGGFNVYTKPERIKR
ncbi:formate dehydrogenase accessory sulfurtransferase FdhD [Pseudalkalibacillus hwajinpoensis]|uniref:formate dehydrogenase accessory sulfurtransferase FdhD n=1 Tax=Guptibacillus hwajinpoensis TaxID=208199 RepID=UPI001CD61A84|nr:formate dehydrogenase accessory sulfurtransferase FdhD [Pseudalkalibacillus hwajinpoensis]MCA0989875.1 formate dehydrogenase accessory sulfurtransferase FdhD [Pseudalkalibacillus hwajinpoensis]